MSVYKGDKLVAGSGITPEYVRNQNILSDYDAVTFPFTAQYDGILTVACPTNSGVRVSVNGVEIGRAVYVEGYSTSNSTTVAVNKGDVMTLSGNVDFARARWYKLRDYTGR